MPVIDWTTYIPAVAVNNYRSNYIELPAFNITTGIAWKGASEVVLQYNFSAPKDFVFLRRPTKPSGVNYGLCVRYRVGDTVTRYALWEDARFILSNTAAPLYNGERIRANFVLEVWSFDGETTAVNTDAILMTVSLRTAITGLAERSTTEAAEGEAFDELGQEAQATSLPSGIFAWYRAEDQLPSAPTTITDHSGNGRDFTTPATGYAFETPAEFVSGTEAIIFNGIDQGAVADYTGAGSLPITIYALMAHNTGGAAVMMEMRDGGAASMWNFQERLSSPNVRLFATPDFTNDISFALNEYDVVIIQIGNGGELNLKIGNLPFETVAHTASPTTLGQFTIGASLVGVSTLANFSKFKFAEMIVYNTFHNTTQNEQVVSFLRQKYLGGLLLPATYNIGGPWLDNDPL